MSRRTKLAEAKESAERAEHRRAAAAQAHRQEVKAYTGKQERLETLLCNLLQLEPSLERFRIDVDDNFYVEDTMDWDYKGIQVAVDHLNGRRQVDKYKKETK